MSTPLCECGCGQSVNVAAKTNRRRGQEKGKPYRFLMGHAARTPVTAAVRWPTTKRDRWEANVSRSADGCWNWVGPIDKGGYGRQGDALAHRVGYELLVGPIPDGLPLDHLCHNRRCVNSAHLEPVTVAENNRRSGGWVLRGGKCKHGHDVTDPSNVSANRRRCLECERLRDARRYAAKRAAA